MNQLEVRYRRSIYTNDKISIFTAATGVYHRVETDSFSESDSPLKVIAPPLLTSLFLLPFRPYFVSRNPHMLFKSTAVITFLVPILALLASTRATPSTGLQPRDDANDPFSVSFAEPQGDIHPGKKFNITFTVTQNKVAGSEPPWLISLYAVAQTKSWFYFYTVNVDSGEWPFEVTVPPNMPLGPALLSCNEIIAIPALPLLWLIYFLTNRSILGPAWHQQSPAGWLFEDAPS
ncbi:hypothetical protein BC826DRAFT_1060007 [Russula brevipes]|nr:hypothetical protein BC826DRAFT_1060007 [Russula brevipes]